MRVIKEVHWPEIKTIDGSRPAKAIAAIYDYLVRMRKSLALRDQKIAKAINAGDIEVVSAVPSEAPDFGGPCLRIYDDGAGTQRLYAWVNGSWRYTALS